MRMKLVLGLLMAMLLLIGARCRSTATGSCCSTNDLCPTKHTMSFSCSPDRCGTCVRVAPLTITVTSIRGWKDPKIGQATYRLELRASGGLAPYTWGDLILTNNTKGKLSWLTLRVDESDSSRAYLTNRVENGTIAVPTEKSDEGEDAAIAVTVNDSSRHGAAKDRVDNTGYTFRHAIGIRECGHECVNGDGCCPSGCGIGNDNDCPPTCDFSAETDCPPSPGEARSLTIAGVKLTMRYVPGGTFTQTAENATEGTLTVDGFWMGETEVTYEVWSAVYGWAKEQGYTLSNAGREGSNGSEGVEPTAAKQEPVTLINWRDAMAWCNAASEAAGLHPVYYADAECTTPIRVVNKNRVPTAKPGTEDKPYVQNDADGFRLPLAAEWECAARYDNGASWTPGNYASGATADINNAAATETVAWYALNSNDTTHIVATRTSNALGLFDMSGNVWEWCFDRDPQQGSFFRKIRGGSFNDGPEGIQVGEQSNNFGAWFSFMNFGLRVVQTK